MTGKLKLLALTMLFTLVGVESSVYAKKEDTKKKKSTVAKDAKKSALKDYKNETAANSAINAYNSAVKKK